MITYDIVKSVLVLAALLLAGGVFAWRSYQLLWLNLRRGQPSGAFGQWGERLKGVLLFVGGQRRLFRFLVPGTRHFFIFWGFMTLAPTIVNAIIEGLVVAFNPQYVLPVLGEWGPLAFLQDLMAVAVAVAVSFALYVRLVVNPKRYEGSHRKQGVLVLAFILIIMISLLLMNAGRISLGEDRLAAWRPLSGLISRLFTGLNATALQIVVEASYWIHLVIVFLFLAELPQGKHFHVATSIPAVLLRNLAPPGQLPPAPRFDEEVGVSAVEQLRWRQMLDLYTCTECGRCQEVCPAYASGLSLSPKHLILGLRDNLKARGSALHNPQGNGSAAEIMAESLLGDVIPEDEIWSCITCYACDQECPLFIEHVTPIVDMRRSLVAQGQVDNELQGALVNLARYGNSFGKSPRARARWTRGLTSKIKDARQDPVEILWFVGDYASYSPALEEITLKTAELFQKVGLDFGIMYEAEHNAGNDVRRIGEEGLFEMLLEKNSSALVGCSYKAIVTTDPHTYNTLKNEYPASINSDRPILHYSELLDQLIASGQLTLTRQLGTRVTYQDPCYLGRYNGVYDAPRRVIRATGCQLIEMPRHHDRAFCCGAGGGRIWMDEGPIKERPSEIRVREAAALDDVTMIVVSCPKDITMFRDAVKTTGHEQDLVVKDLIELVYEAL